MKNTTQHTGRLEVIERAPSSHMGNPRYVVRLDGITCRIAVNSPRGYAIPNFDGCEVTANIGTHRGIVTIADIRRV